MSYISGEDRNQSILFPESLEEYIASDNPVRIINEYVTQLDLQALNLPMLAHRKKADQSIILVIC